MPNPEDEAFIRESIQFYGDKSPYWVERVQAAEASSQRRLAAYVAFHGDQVYTEEPEQTALAAFDFLNQSREDYGLPTLPRMPNVDRIVTPDGRKTESSILGGAGKGVRAGAMAATALAMSPFLPREENQRNYAAADKIGSETQGTPAQLASIVARTGTEMLPQIAAGMGVTGIVKAIPGIAKGVAAAAPLVTGSALAGAQTGVQEFEQRTTAGMGGGEAAKIALSKAAVTAGLTALSGHFGGDPVVALSDPVRRKIAFEATKSFLGAVAKSSGVGALEEGLDQMASSAIDKWMAGDAVTLEQAAKDVAMAAGLGALFSAGAENVSQVASKLTNERKAGAKAATVAATPPAPPIPGPGAIPAAGNPAAAAATAAAATVKPGKKAVAPAPTPAPVTPAPTPAPVTTEQLAAATAAANAALATSTQNGIKNRGILAQVEAKLRAKRAAPIDPKAPVVPTPDIRDLETAFAVAQKPDASANELEAAALFMGMQRDALKTQAQSMQGLIDGLNNGSITPEQAQAILSGKAPEVIPDLETVTTRGEADKAQRAGNILDAAKKTPEALQHAVTGTLEGNVRRAPVAVKPLTVPAAEVPAVKEILSGRAGLSPEQLAQLDAQTTAAPPEPKPVTQPRPVAEAPGGDRAPVVQNPVPVPEQTPDEKQLALGREQDQAQLRAQKPPALEPVAEAPKPLTPDEQATIDEIKTRTRAPVSEGAPAAKIPKVERFADTLGVDVENLEDPGNATMLRDKLAARIRDAHEQSQGTIARSGDNAPEAIRSASFNKVWRDVHGDQEIPIFDSSMNPDEFKKARAKAVATVERTIKRTPIGAPVKVRVAPGKNAQVQLYQAPDSWTPVVDEYTKLYSRFTKDETSLDSAEKDRMYSISAAIRLYQSEAVAQQIVARLSSTPRSERRTVAKRFTDAVTRDVTGLNQDLDAIVNEQGLTNPSKLSEIHARRYIGEVLDGAGHGTGEFAVVVHRKGRLSVADDTGKAFVHGKGVEETPAPLTEDQPSQVFKPGERKIMGRSPGDLVSGNTEPHFGDVISMVSKVQGMALNSPKVELSKSVAAWMNTNGLSADVAGDHFKQAVAADETLNKSRTVPGVREEPGRVDLTSEKNQYRAAEGRRPAEAPGDWLARILLPSTNDPTALAGETVRVVKKWIPKAELDAALKNIEGGREALKNLRDLKLIKSAGQNYTTGDVSKYYRKTTPIATVSNPIVTPSGVETKSIQVLMADSAAASSMGTGVADLGKNISGAYYSPNGYSVIAQSDPVAFTHEWVHHLTLPFILGPNPAQMPTPAAHAELLAIAGSYPGTVTLGEGLARIGENYALDPVATAKTYPEATAYLEGLIDLTGQKVQFAALSEGLRAHLAATPEQRQAARIRTAEFIETAEDRYAKMPWYVRLQNSFDSSAVFESVRGMLHTNKGSNDASTLHNISQQADAAAEEQYWHGLTNAAGQRYGTSFGDVYTQLQQISADMGIPLTQAQAFLNALAMYDRNPGERRKYNVDEQIGWSRILDPKKNPEHAQAAGRMVELNSDQEIDEANLLIKDAYDQQVANAKKAGLPAPPPPSYFKHIRQAENESVEAFKDAAANIEKFKNSPLMALAKGPLKEANDNMVKWRFENGLSNRATTTRNLAQKFYMPLKTALENTIEKQAKGSAGKDYVDGFDMLHIKLHTLMSMVVKQDTARSYARGLLVETSRRRDDGAGLAKKRDGDLVPIGDLAQFMPLHEAISKGKALAEKSKGLKADSPVSHEYVTLKLDDLTIEELVNAGHIETIASPADPAFAAELAELKAKYNGRPYAFRVRNPTIRASLNASGAPFVPVHWMLRLPAQLVRQLATTLNPEYWIRGFLRDMISAPIQATKPMDIVLHPIKYGQSLLEGGRAAIKASAGADHAPISDALDDALVARGIAGTAFRNEHPTAVTATQNRELLARVGHRIESLGFLRGLARVSDSLELTNRFAEARRVVLAHLAGTGKTFAEIQTSDPRLAQEALAKGFRAAQEIGVNFRKTGTSAAFRQFASMVPFLNPSVQGLLSSVRTISGKGIHADSNNAADARMIRAAASAAVLVIPAMVQLLALRGADEEDRERFNELPDSERMKYYHLPIGNGLFARFPKPQGLYSGAIAAIEGAFMSDPRTWGEIATDALKDAGPQSLVPTALQLGWELASGERVMSTTGFGTIPERLKGVADAESRAAPGLADTLGHFFGMPPIAVENLVRGYTGGLGWVLLDAPQAIQDAIGADTRADYTPANYPIARVLALKDPTWNKRSISTFYDMMEELGNQSKSLKEDKRKVQENRMTMDELLAHLAENKEIEYGAGAAESLRRANQQFSKARIGYENINRDTTITEVERRIQMDDLMDMMTDAARIATAEVKAAAADAGVKLQIKRRAN